LWGSLLDRGGSRDPCCELIERSQSRDRPSIPRPIGFERLFAQLGCCKWDGATSAMGYGEFSSNNR
jgi:hypothetical protein